MLPQLIIVKIILPLKITKGEHSSNILVTCNAIGLYIISLEDLSDVNFIRLHKTMGSVSKIVLDPHFDDVFVKNNDVPRKPRQQGSDKDDKLVVNVLETEKMKPFPIYVLDSFNGFVQRIIVQPQSILSDKGLNDTFNDNCAKERKNGNAENFSSMVSFYFNLFIIFEDNILSISFTLG